MAISPPSDIILDVARAVEPANLETARNELIKRAGNLAMAGISKVFSLGDMRATVTDTKAADTPETPKAYQKFEAMVLQSFIESMLPKQSGAVYGEGLAGDMWKSLMAKEISGVMAERGGIGIADSLLRDHYKEGETKVALAGVSGGPEKAELDTQTMLSKALIQEMQRKLTQSIDYDRSMGAKP